jgi:hypothetical protein
LALSRDQLLRLARSGAASRVRELREEIASIVKAFPDLRRGVGQIRTGAKTRGRRLVKAVKGAQARATANDRWTRRRGWTAAQRKAAAERMKAIWAKRKKSK